MQMRTLMIMIVIMILMKNKKSLNTVIQMNQTMMKKTMRMNSN